jgi:hypothetical protein
MEDDFLGAFKARPSTVGSLNLRPDSIGQHLKDLQPLLGKLRDSVPSSNLTGPAGHDPNKAVFNKQDFEDLVKKLQDTMAAGLTGPAGHEPVSALRIKSIFQDVLRSANARDAQNSSTDSVQITFDKCDTCSRYRVR